MQEYNWRDEIEYSYQLHIVKFYDDNHRIVNRLEFPYPMAEYEAATVEALSEHHFRMYPMGTVQRYAK